MGDMARGVVAELLLAAGPLGSALLAWRARERAAPDVQPTWLLVAEGSLLAFVGQAVWAFQSVVLGVLPAFPSPPYYLFLAFHVLLATGAVLALRPARTGLGVEIGLDGALVLLAIAALVLRFVLEPPLARGDISLTQTVAMLLGQLASAGSLFFTALLVVWRDTELPAPAVFGLFATAAVFALGNVLSGLGLDPHPGAPGDAFDLVWLAGWLLLMLTGWAAARHPSPERAPAGRAASERRGRLARRARAMIIPAAALFLALAVIDAGTRRRHFTLLSAVVLGAMGVVLAVRIGNALRAAEREAEDRRRAQAAASQARLRVLTSQLNPHFLFNALHSLSGLLRRDPERAQLALAHLGDLLRYALDESEQTAVYLADEWAFTEHYLEIERLRLGERLRVRTALEPAALDCRVPPFLLQPLVENAVRHGVAKRAEGGRVSVAAHIHAGRLEIEVGDDGPGADPGAVSRAGVGLRAVRGQLEARYGHHAGFAVDTAPGAGFRVRLSLPAQHEAEARVEARVEARSAPARP